MTIAEIIAEVFPRCPDYIQQMLTEIQGGIETEENWFLKEAIRFVERESLNLTGYYIFSFCTNRESDETAPLHRALIQFWKDAEREEDFREFYVEVRNNRKRRCVVWKRAKEQPAHKPMKYTLVNHIREGIVDGNGNIPANA